MQGGGLKFNLRFIQRIFKIKDLEIQDVFERKQQSLECLY